MTYEEFCKKARNRMHETIYSDSDGREILVIRMLDAYALLTRPWVGLTDGDVFAILEKLQTMYHRPPRAIFVQAIEAKLKEKNT